MKILTGDNRPSWPATSAGASGSTNEQVVTGDEIDRTGRRALGHVAEQARGVRARVAGAEEPDHPRAEAPRARGGFHGRRHQRRSFASRRGCGHFRVDGRGDVARDAADIILGERGLRVLHRGILEGRRASGNMMKYLLMGTSSNFGNMFSMAAASVFLPFLPMLPTQILLNNFLYDLAQITIPDRQRRRELPAPSAALEHARDPRLHAVHRPGQLAVRFPHLLRAAARLSRSGGVVSHRLVRRVAGHPDPGALRHSHDGQPVPEPAEPWLTITTLTVVAVGVGLPATPIAAWLGFTILPGSYFAFLIPVTVAYLVMVDVAKRQLVRRLDM